MTGGVMVTGMSGSCAFGHGLDVFAAGLEAGRSGITGTRAQDAGDDAGEPRFRARLPGDEQDGLLGALEGSPEHIRQAAVRLVRRGSRQLRVALAVAVEAWHGAGLDAAVARGTLDASRIGLVVAGGELDGRYSARIHTDHATRPSRTTPSFAVASLSTSCLGVVSETLGVTGPGHTVSLASAGGNAAIMSAARLIRCGEVDVCLVLGTMTEPSAVEFRAMANLGALAWDKLSAPFDVSACGFVHGEAAACLVLESAEHAHRRDAMALAELAGYANVLDASSLPDPHVAGEIAAMRRAISSAGLVASDIDYVNAHGTGSVIGDRTEAAALNGVFGGTMESGRRPWVNSTKSLIGHAIGAAGVVEAVATIIQMRQGFVHANAGLTNPITEACRFVGPNTDKADIRAALSNSFAFGGVNTSVVFVAP